MFVKNYYTLLSTYYNRHGKLDETCYFTRTDGEKRYLVTRNYYTHAAQFFLNNDALSAYMGRVATASLTSHLLYGNDAAYSGVFFGDGDVPVTIDDYFLSGNIISNLTWSDFIEATYDENGYTATSVFTLTNNNSESVTIKEIALCGLVRFAYDSITATGGNGNYQRVMIERTVLDAPVTIPAGGVGQVTYTVRVNYPTA